MTDDLPDLSFWPLWPTWPEHRRTSGCPQLGVSPVRMGKSLTALVDQMSATPSNNPMEADHGSNRIVVCSPSGRIRLRQCGKLNTKSRSLGGIWNVRQLLWVQNEPLPSSSVLNSIEVGIEGEVVSSCESGDLRSCG